MTDAILRTLLPIALGAGFVVWERWKPARASALTLTRLGRHVVIAALGSVAARLVLGAGLVGVALWARDQGFGLFNWLALPVWLEILGAVILLDLAIWAQHLAMHHVPVLWRLHRVHHSDVVMDVSTGFRFHPLEIIVSLGLKAVCVIALGAPALAVVIFEMILGAGALFSHANIALPNWLDRRLGVIWVTPRLHLIHHSPHPPETNSNFGFSTILWDRIFGTYRGARLRDDQTIGLDDERSEQYQTLLALLVQPFRVRASKKEE